MNAGYSPKDLKFGDDGRSRLIEGITKLSQAVKSTLGPSGNTVLIESPHHTHGITVTKVVDSLKNRSRPLTKKMMLDVATISSNNDESVGKIIADVYNKVGKTGMVTVEKSQGSETTFETTTGIKVDRGYATPLFINNHKKDECVYDDCLVLVSDAEIDNIHSIEKVLTHVVEPSKNRKLLIIAPCSQQLTNTLAANVMKQKVKICTIQPPNFGYKQHELMQDIALSLGATYFSEATGDDLSLIKPSDLGVAKKVIVGQDQTIILKEDGSNVDSVKKRVSELKEAAKLATRKEDKDFILSRIASLTGGIGVIRVGGNTDLEQKELFDRVDDAVCAVRSALEEGILPGGGVALYNEHQKIEMKLLNEEYKKAEDLVAATILSDALCSPVCQIIINAGSSFADVYETAMNLVTKEGHGFDVKNAKYGDLIEMGVIDPLKVTRVALQNAVSVAVSILSTNAIITMARTYEQS
jgi:chaperonin GroEL